MGAVVYCHYGEPPYLVCLEGEGLVMTSHFLHPGVQKEVEVEGDLFAPLHSCPTRVVSPKVVEEAAQISQVEGQGDVSQVTGSSREGVAYAPLE